MSKILPLYLSNIATNIVESKKTIMFNIICKCGNRSFVIFRNSETPEETIKREKWEALIKEYDGGGYSDCKGNLFLTKKLFGIKTKQIKLNKSELPQYNTILKAKCSKCGKDYLLFDSRKNGYNALVNKLNIDKTDTTPVIYKKFTDKVQSVKIKIINDLSYDELTNDFQKISMKDFSNAFSDISIYIAHQNKNKCIFTTETR